MNNPFLIGSRIYLRPLERADAPRLAPWFNDAEIRRNIYQYRPRSFASQEAFLAKMAESEHDFILGIALAEDDALIGVTGLHDIENKNRHAQLGITIGDKEAWGRGYGTEASSLMVGYAFGTLNLNRIWLHVYARNARAIRVYEKIGFRKEGVLRQHGYIDGEYLDTVTMAILREDWRQG
jgi:RimJ/RimL family protein N-acetyltransferase